MTDTDVLIVGGGPAGLMLAGELCLAGVRPLVLERHGEQPGTERAGGLGGQILELLRYRGLLEEVLAACPRPEPAQVFPFGGLHVDLSGLADPPLRGLPLPQRRLERLLADRAAGLGAVIRRGHPVTGLSQDEETVTARVSGPDGPYPVTARYLAGCDGGHSLVRELAGIAFPGVTYPEVNRLGRVTVPGSVTVLGDGDLQVPGTGRVRAGFTQTSRGVFALGPAGAGSFTVMTTEDDPAAAACQQPLTLAELSGSIRRVLGADLPLGDPQRLTRFTHQARQAERYRAGRVLLAGDAAHLFPATGVGLSTGMLDAVNLAWKLAAQVGGWAPDGLLDTYHDERRYAGARTMRQAQAQVALRRGRDQAADALREVVAELLEDEQPRRRLGAMIAGRDVRYPVPGSGHHPLAGTFAPGLALREAGDAGRAARPVLLDLAGRPELREAARDWAPRVEVRAAVAESRPADALLILPDGYVAWAADAGSAVPGLRAALSRWFGAPAGRGQRSGLRQVSS